MDWTARFTLSHALEIRVTPTGSMVAQGSMSQAPLNLTPDLLLALLSFAGGVTATEALARLSDRFGVERDAFETSVAGLITSGYVVPVGDAAAPAATGLFSDVLLHVTMLADKVRVAAYRDALAIAAPGQRVLDLGTGSGLLAVLAARAGARRVFAIEETAMADLAVQVFAAAGCEVTLVRRSSRDVVLDEPVDVIVHELLGSDPLAEGMLPSICDARRRLLVPGGRLVPHRIEILCVGVGTGGAARDRAATLKSLAGVAAAADALTPLADAVRALPGRAFVVNLGDASFEVLTEPLPLHDLDLTSVGEDACAAPVHGDLRVTRHGRLDAIVTYFRAHLAEGIVLSNAPDTPHTHWEHRITGVSAARAVMPGDRVAVAAWRETALKYEQLVVDVVS